jgi:hypothetical protein
MGREIVYCWNCATRIDGGDFEKKKAFRHQDKVSCEGCVYELVGELPAEEQERILAGDITEAPTPVPSRKGTGAVPKIEPSSGGTSVRRKTGPMPKATGRIRPATGGIPRIGGGTKRMTRAIPRPEPGEEIVEGEEIAEDPSARKKKVLLMSGIGGGAALLLIVVLIFAFSGGKKKPVSAPEAPAESSARRPAKEPPKPAEPSQAVKTALIELNAFEKSNPESWGELIKKWREVEQLAAGTDVAKDAAHEVEVLLARLQKAADGLDEQAKPGFSAGEYKAVLDQLGTEKARHDVPEWTAAVEKKIEQYKGIIADKWRSQKAKAEEAKANDDAAALQDVGMAIAKWGIREYIEEFSRIATAKDPARDPAAAAATPAGTAPKGAPKKPSTKPTFSKPLSPEMQAFLPAWKEAAGLAFNRNFESAAVELTKAARGADADEVKRAANEDADLIRAAGQFLLQELSKAAGEIKRLSTVTVEYLHAPGIWKEVTGRVSRIGDGRLELKIQIPSEDPKEKKVREEVRLIEFADLGAATLAGLLKAAKKPLDPKRSLLAAHLCFLEGDLEGGRALAGSQPLPERLLVWAGEAREAAPRGGGREFEARDLFHKHELEWKSMETWGPAIDKARTLVNDFATARIVRENLSTLTQRMGEGKETIFYPSMLKAVGDANTFVFKKDSLHWVTSKDIDFNESLYNHLDAEFYAVPGVSYRAWAYVGGCCQQVFGALYQTSEGTVKHKGKDVTINPGDAAAPPISMTSGLKKEHEDHKPKGDKEHPKTPAKWAWVSIPLPKEYQTPGPKIIRLLTDQEGFGVKYVVVSSLRTTMPDKAMTAELDGKAQAVLEAAPRGATGPKGTPEPKNWYVIGPFEAKLAADAGPEANIDLKAALKGSKGDVKWKPYQAPMKGSNVILDWAKQKIYDKPENTAAYAVIHVKSPAALDAQIICSHDDGGKILVNGTKVHENDRAGGIKTDEFKVRVKLEEGWNRILFKIRNGNNASFGFQMRLTDGAGEPIPGVEWHPLGDSLDL